MFSHRPSRVYSALLARMNVCGTAAPCRPVDVRSPASRTAMDEFGGNTSESWEGRRDKVCVCECAPCDAPPSTNPLVQFHCIHCVMAGHSLASPRLAPRFFSISRSLAVPFFSIDCPALGLLVTRQLLRLGAPFLHLQFTLVYCVFPAFFADGVAVYLDLFVLIRWSLQILNCRFDSSPGPHILLVNLFLPSLTSRAFVAKKTNIFSRLFYDTGTHLKKFNEIIKVCL